MEYVQFSWIDYTLFGLMFGLSGLVGIYFGFCGKQDTTSDYLHGGKKMKVFPVAMSLVASTLSGISLLGIPAEVYMHGTQYWMMIISIVLLGFTVNYVFMPVFYKLQLTSVFEYLELRFDKRIRTLTSIMYTVGNLTGLPLVIYAPSLAFNQVTGYDVHLISPIMSLMCIFYTTIGGVKAVVWTDTLQFCVTLCTLGCVLVMGTISVGGFGNIWEKAQLGDRIEFFNMDLDPTKRSTFWNVVLGSWWFWTCFIGTNQGIVQRFLAVPTFRDAQKILVVFVIFTVITKSISCFSGLIMYAKYFDCDPYTAGITKKPDQILPYYVLDVASQVPGLSGLFVAGLFSTALSTLSTALNSLAGVMYQDFIAPFMPKKTSEKTASTAMKILTLVIGIVIVGLVFVVEKLGSVLQLVLSLSSITGGPMLGLFTMGMLFPIANRKGALWGIISSLLIMLVIVGKNQYLIFIGAMKTTTKPFSTLGCNITSNTTSIFLNETTYFPTTVSSTTVVSSTCPEEEPHWLFRISFYYYLFIGSLLTLIIGLLVSWITKDSNEPPVDSDLLSPCIHRFLQKSAATTRYESVEKEMRVIGMEETGVDYTKCTFDKLLQK